MKLKQRLNPTLLYNFKRLLSNKPTPINHVTTPIFYVNAQPHIGHLYTAVVADAITRYYEISGQYQYINYMTGTDEHGLKIHQAAKKDGSSTLEYVNTLSGKYRDLFKLYNVHFTDFLRTTEDRHRRAVARMWTKLLDKDLIYKSTYSGWYCVADETFVPQSHLQIMPDGTKRTADSGQPVEFVSETNYKFRLSQFKTKLLDWLKNDVIRPEKFQRILISWIEEGVILEDISVSRPCSRVPWGIPVPGDPDHTIYVWLDALCCYLTSAGYPDNLLSWPPKVQVIGKDILKFHGVYWPAFLIGADLDPPSRLLCHSHWIIDGEKMSKSKGNVVDPIAEAEQYSTEGFRYFLLREGVPHSDGNYSSVKIRRILNSELADTLGNLLNRCTGTLVNSHQVFPGFSQTAHEQFCVDDGKCLIEAVENLPGIVDLHYNNYEFYKGIDAILSTLRLGNEFFERKKPWVLRKSPGNFEELSAVLHITMETLRVCGVLLYPIVPILSSRILTKLGVPESQRSGKFLLPLSWQRKSSFELTLSQEKVILFTRLKDT